MLEILQYQMIGGLSHNDELNKDSKQHKKIAIIGGGPAGLTAAAFLAKTGNNVTIFEKYDYLGGLLVHGIPDFRLPIDITQKTIYNILKVGGLWINVGPLLYHHTDSYNEISIELAWNEIKQIIIGYGFEFTKEKRIETANHKTSPST